MSEILVQHLATTEGAGGVHTAIAAQCSAMDQLGIDSFVTYFAKRDLSDIAQTFQDQGLQHQLGSSQMLPTLINLSRLFKRIVSARNRRSVLHIHSGLPFITSKVDLLRRLFSRQIPVVLTLHGPSDLYPYSTHKEQWDRHGVLCHKWATIVVPSDFESEFQQKLCGPSVRPTAIANACVKVPERLRGLGQDQLLRNSESPSVVTIARLAPEKNTLPVLEAFEIVAAKLPNAQLTVIGDGPMRGQLESRVQSMPEAVRKRIRFLGHIQYPQRLLNSKTVFVSLSVSESFGLVALEAALAGAPLVLSSIRPWVDYFEDRAECIFVDPTNTLDIANQIESLLTDEDCRNKLAAKGESRGMLISSDAVVGESWKKLYTSLIRR